MAMIKLQLLLLLSYFLLSIGFSLISSQNAEQDECHLASIYVWPGLEEFKTGRVFLMSSIEAQVLLALKGKWNNTPQSWGSSNDPCGMPWEGITCDLNRRVTELQLSSSGLVGEFPDVIGNLTELTALDLSYNRGLTGQIPSSLGNLTKLFTLTLESCSFTGNIPTELGNAVQLSYISLCGNNLTGEIPMSMGKLSNLHWLDIADNQLTGSIPVSGSGTLGLDQLKKLQAIVLHNNQLSGSIPQQLFSSDMPLTKLQIRSNKLSGGIPDSLYLVKTLETLDLGLNSLTGSISSAINNLTGLVFLNLEGNNFTGQIPDLTGMDTLNFVLLGNNSFDRSPIPAWFSSLQNLQVLFLEHSSLYGPMPNGIFSLPQINTVILNNNELNGTLDMSYVASYHQLGFVDLENNNISQLKITPDFNNTLLLSGNPYCEESGNSAGQSFCKPFTFT